MFPIDTKKKPLILRVIQNHDTLLYAKNVQENQGRFILFLARNPDNETYGFYSIAHKVRLDNRGAKFSFEDKEYDVLDGSINADNFVKAVKEKSVK